MPSANEVLKKRALQVNQNDKHPLFLFTLTGDEILQICDISRISRNKTGKLIGYQRKEVKRHVEDIIEYLDQPDIIFPNSIIVALSSSVVFKKGRGPSVSDGHAAIGTLEILIPEEGGKKPGWIVDGQQRTLALSKAKRGDFPVPISAFIADNVSMQRDQFIRVNNTKPLPKGLVTELLPEMDMPLPAKLAARKMPSALCDMLNQEESSPFFRLIKRASSTRVEKKDAVITDTSIIKMLEESLGQTSGCLFPYRNLATGETDFEGIWSVLTLYWSAVRDTFPEAWAKPPSKSRLMHGVGIRAMGRLMDKIMSSVNPSSAGVEERIMEELMLIKSHCSWTSGQWDGLGGIKWNDLQNVPKHIGILSNYIIRTYLHEKRA